jgi:hypothetical protein
MMRSSSFDESNPSKNFPIIRTPNHTSAAMIATGGSEAMARNPGLPEKKRRSRMNPGVRRPCRRKQVAGCRSRVAGRRFLQQIALGLLPKIACFQNPANVDEIVTNIDHNLASVAEILVIIAEILANIAESLANIAENLSNVAEKVGDIAENLGDVADNLGDVAENLRNVADNLGDVDDKSGGIAANRFPQLVISRGKF